MAAPRCCTVVMKSPFSQASSATASVMALPATVPCATSGYCEDEWLPQMITFFTSLTGVLVRSATWTSSQRAVQSARHDGELREQFLA